MTHGLQVVMTLAFFPRGGAAQVVRYLTRALEDRGLGITVCCGSLGQPGESSHAQTFFAGLNVEALDFTEAVSWFEQGRDPMAAPVPMHPSFEDRPAVPDRVFAAIDDHDYHHQVAVWRSALEGIGPPDLYHVHHLTHVNDALLQFSDVPVVAHLHGTELKMLAEIRSGSTNSWPHALAWEERLVAAAQRASRLIVVSPSDRDLAVELLGVEPGSIEVVPNGVDLGRFSADPVPPKERLVRWSDWLVDDPLGWDQSGVVGSIRYSESDLRRGFVHPISGDPLPILLFVGRFLGFKRVPLLIRAYAKARDALGPTAPPLVIWGGHPGEWEGEHPHTVAESLGVDGVFFIGWRGHEDLSLALNCSDVFVAPSVDEPFGQVYLEAMAAALPVIATDSGGPPSFINTDPDQPTGWLVTPDAEEELSKAIIEAVSNPIERQKRGHRGRSHIEGNFDWSRVAQQVETIYLHTLATHDGQ